MKIMKTAFFNAKTALLKKPRGIFKCKKTKLKK